MNTSEWREVSKAELCPVCEKPDWCSIIGPEGEIEAAVCMRIESDNCRPNGGWLHRLRESTRCAPVTFGDKPRRVFGTASEAVEALEKHLGTRSRIWKYSSAAGDPVGVVGRWDKQDEKTIRPISRVADGWVIGAMAEPRPLYCLPEVLPAALVVIVEGEKACDAIRSLGLAATTSSGGSAAAAKTDWSPLAGKQIILSPDNDEPGEKYIAAVQSMLAKIKPAPTLKVLRFPGLPDKGDAADWVAAGGTRTKFDALLIAADAVELSPADVPTGFRRPKQIKLAEAAQAYIDRLKAGETGLIERGIPELDYALGGGVEFGEMVIAAARPSHGKSAFALQCNHHLNAMGIPSLIVSEEMSSMALGKRTLQFASGIPQERWETSVDGLERDLEEYKSGRATCVVSEPCVTPQAVVESIERAISEFGVQAVVIDYAQLLQGKGKSRYEQVSHVSNSLREAASRFNVLLIALCQLNREIEKRNRFIPVASDIRDAGTLEQDADVILLLAWPHRVDAKQPPNQYQIFVAKNRNRPIHQPLVVCRFDPSRQTITESSAREMANFHPEFEPDPFR